MNDNVCKNQLAHGAPEARRRDKQTDGQTIDKIRERILKRFQACELVTVRLARAGMRPFHKFTPQPGRFGPQGFEGVMAN